ncbi:hypothetical protein [Paenibacillus sp. MSJ-34]|uniref:hypothetical protein n=1 Tax=Paenibacillus sp. MSJ-34 TaxID=2841529 RepID=UPI001C101C27|nr:hypothetical protein [Paenibacillus sp. MSJ-34]MBU5444193.1 hypothetical protein [Paenibacillus sp. MSJ-34]
MQETTTNTKVIPLDYAYRTIRGYLWQNNYQQKLPRIIVVEQLFKFDDEKKTKFKDIKAIQQEPSIYDDQYILPFFQNYLTNHQIEAVTNRRTTKFHKILYEIAAYLTKGKNPEHDIITPYRVKRDEYRLVFPEKILKVKEATIETLEAYDIDNLFKHNSQLQSDLKNAYIIPDKKGKKNGISWESINELKIKYEDMTKREKEMCDTINSLELILASNINLSKWTQKKINEIIVNLKLQVNASYFSSTRSPKQVGKSVSTLTNKFECNENFWANQIVEYLDYTNPRHISGLITNFFDLHQKHKTNVGNPLYAILHDFILHMDKIKLSDTHRQIVNTYMFYSSNKKEVSEKLKMDTEKMNKMLHRTITHIIAEYFKNVGN